MRGEDWCMPIPVQSVLLSCLCATATLILMLRKQTLCAEFTLVLCWLSPVVSNRMFWVCYDTLSCCVTEAVLLPGEEGVSGIAWNACSYAAEGVAWRLCPSHHLMSRQPPPSCLAILPRDIYIMPTRSVRMTKVPPFCVLRSLSAWVRIDAAA